ncbi:MAG: DUF4256 domain-containing protein [Sphaerochaetaceae bacterium]
MENRSVNQAWILYGSSRNPARIGQNPPSPVGFSALFADRRYGTVFVYHNSAPSYYGVRGFRCVLRV